MTNTLKILVIPDVHAPYHDAAAFACVLDVARRWKPDVAVVLGDFADFAAVSSHPKDPGRLLPFDAEVKGVNAALDQLGRALRGCKTKHYLEGNHETRLSRFVLKMAPELRTFVDWRDMLHLDKRGWRVTPYKESIQYGKLGFTHDVGRAGVNAARQSMLDMGASLVFGHTHRLQIHYQGQLRGDRHVGATLGWLGCPLAIDYRHRDSVTRDSIHGFGVVHMRADGAFWLQAIPIIRGRCIVDGEMYGPADR